MGTPTPSGPSQPTGPVPNAPWTTARVGAPPGLAPLVAEPAAMEGAEAESGEDEVAVVDHTGQSSAGAAVRLSLIHISEPTRLALI
eukprot:12062338-Alexandrium_andersonii.AAC.1